MIIIKIMYWILLLILNFNQVIGKINILFNIFNDKFENSKHKIRNDKSMRLRSKINDSGQSDENSYIIA